MKIHPVGKIIIGGVGLFLSLLVGTRGCQVDYPTWAMTLITLVFLVSLFGFIKGFIDALGGKGI